MCKKYLSICTTIKYCFSFTILLLGLPCLPCEPVIAQIQWHGVDTLDVAVFSPDACVSIDDSGNIYTAWVVPALISPESLYTAEYTPAGGWTPRALFNTGAERVFLLNLDVNVNGNGALVWSGHNGLFASIRTSGSEWQTRVAIDSGSSPFLNFANHPKVKMDSAGSSLLVWGNDNGDRVLSSKRSPSTNQWTTPDIVTTQSGGFAFDRGANGDGMVLWERGGISTNTTIFASHFVGSQGPGNGWQPPDSLYSSGPTGHSPSVSVNSRGDAVAVWFEHVSAVYAARFIHNQGWQSTEILSMDSNGPQPAKIGINSSGNAVVLWVNVFDKAIYAHRYIPGSGWQQRDTILAPPLGLRGEPVALPPHIDDNGNLLVMFLPRDFSLGGLQTKRYLSGSGWQQTETPLFMANAGEVYLAMFKVNAIAEGVLIWEEQVGDGANFYTSRFSIEPSMSIATNAFVPTEFHLSQNFPNPFNPSTKISWQLPVRSHVSLKVYDVLGNEIVTLVNEEKHAGNYEVEFDASQLSSGIYFYRLQTDNYVEMKKMILLK